MKSRNQKLLLLILAAGQGLPLIAQDGEEAPSADRAKPQIHKSEFDNSRPPRGIVRDPSGKPIGGARVCFRSQGDMANGRQWRNRILRAQPLPRVRTSRDGEFFVPLTGLHRLLNTANAGPMHLIVEKDGYHPWVEPLGTGLRGYLGSTVVLSPVKANERLAVRVVRPREGMLLRVHRFVQLAGAVVEYQRWYPLPKSGELSVPLSFLPTPMSGGAQSGIVTPIGIEVQLVFPGRSSKAIAIDLGQKTLTLGEAADVGELVCSLSRADGKPCQKPRGLYRCPDRSARWFPVDPAKVVESPRLPLIALSDAGCVAKNMRSMDPSEKAIALEPIRPASGRGIEIHDSKGEPVPNARTEFFDLTEFPEHRHGAKLGSVRPRRRLIVEGGRLDLSDQRLPGPGFLLVEAPGYSAKLVFDPRDIDGTRRVSLGNKFRGGELELKVKDGDGKPVANVYVVFTSPRSEKAAYHDGLIKTDGRGIARLVGLRRGNHSAVLVKSGYAPNTTSLAVGRAGRKTKKTMKVLASPRYRVLVVDENDQPVPFRSLRGYANMNVAAFGGRAALGGQMASNNVYATDSKGRLLILDMPPQAPPRLTDLINVLVTAPAEPLDEDEINRVTVGATRLIMMPLTDAPPTRECLKAARRRSNLVIARREGCRIMLVRFPTSDALESVSIYMDGSPPMRLTPDLVAAARKKQASGMLVIDQRKITRQVQLKLPAKLIAELANSDELRVELPGLNFNGGRPYIYGDSGVRAKRDKDGLWSFGLRDTGEYKVRIMHPSFLMAEVDIPAAEDEGGDKPSTVELERGSSVRFRLSGSSPKSSRGTMYAYVQSDTNQMVLYQREQVGDKLLKVGPKVWEFPLPVALPAGKYWFTFRVDGTSYNLRRTQFTVKEGEAMVIDVRKRKTVTGIKGVRVKRRGGGLVPVRGGKNAKDVLRAKIEELKAKQARLLEEKRPKSRPKPKPKDTKKPKGKPAPKAKVAPKPKSTSKPTARRSAARR